MDFIQGDFLQMKDIKADIVYIDPVDAVDGSATPENISFDEIKPMLYKLVPKAFKASNGCVVIKLPADTNIEELPELFKQSMEEDSK